ncbi:MAG: tetratricopeptide repeat protein, partial [Bdellovibrionales bacterium]|nr:tetratricopeptide repeat protein [Bdellovibrionales bacterium]
RGAVYAQMGHLYELTGEPNKAMKLYEHILDSEKTPDILAEAQISLAELMFRRRQYQNALIHYREALKFPEFRRRAYASYRVAWSQFNLGELDSAIAELVQLLKIPQQLNERNSVLAGNQSVDVQFMEEVSRDLSTFIARRGLKMEDVESIYNLSPERIRLDNLNFLANELERLGQPIIAAKVWKFSEAKQSDPHKRLEAHIHLAELELHQGNKKGSLAELEKSLRLWGQSEVCKQALCKEFKNAIKNYIVNWNREEKSNPSDELSEAYDQYFAQFSDDLDMLVWAGMAEEKRKNWAKSLKQYSKALALYANAQADEKAGLPSYESLLLTQVEIGEKSENEDLSLLAIDNYLNLSKEKTKWLEVSYQRAYKLYKKGQYEKASTQMRELALDRSVEYFGNAAHLKAPSDESGVQEMKLQAANLALDAAAILKKDHEVEMWSEEFARAFPRKKEEFQDIARRSILNQAVLEAGDLNDLDKVSSAWSILERFRIEEAKDAELITFYKTRMLYSEKLRKLDELGQSIEALLNIKKIKAEDYQLALNRKAWLAELKLDFKTALTLTQNLRSTISPEEKSLQLAIYADLAGLESESYYQKYLNATNDPEKRLAA